MKKTLIISPYAPPSTHGSGLMIYNLFSFLPKEKLAVLTSDNNTDPGVQQYRLPVPYYYYGSEILAMRFNDKQETVLQKLKRGIKNFGPAKFIAQIILLLAIPRKMVAVGKQAVREQGIEMLLGYSDMGTNLFGTYLLHKATGKPFSLFFYDMYVGNKMPVLFRLLARWLEPRLFKHAEKVFVMCEELQQHYQAKYGKPVIVIHNSNIIDPTHQPVFIEQRPAKPKYRIIFLGNVYWAQLGAVQNLVAATESISEIPIELFLYTPHSEEYLRTVGIQKSDTVTLTYCLPQDVPQVLVAADLLVVGLSFNTEWPQLINTSSPGKLGDYLVSGTPILIHAPAEAYISTFAQQNSFAYVVGQDSVPILKNAILELIGNKKMAEQLAHQANQVARQQFNAEINAVQLMSQLS